MPRRHRREDPPSVRAHSRLIWLDRALLRLACLAAFLILILQLAEIGARLIGGSVVIATEVTGFLMAILVFLALPEVTRRREHIAADFLVGMLGPRLRWSNERIVAPVFAATYVVALIYLLQGLAVSSYLDGVRSEGITRTPLVIPQAILIFGLVCTLLRLVLMLLDARGGDAGTGRADRAC